MALLNFRDVATGPGTEPLRPGRLFRAAQPYHLTEADIAVVTDAGIRTIVDLREPREQVAPDWSPIDGLGAKVVRIPVADQILPSADEAEAPTQRIWLQADSVPEGHRILADFYTSIVDRAGIRLGELVAAVADGGPVLLHCAAGKDRTGTTVALLLDLIGVDHEIIVADYLRTGDALDDILQQLSGQTLVQVQARTDIPLGISDAPEVAIRALLQHVESLGGARTLLLRNSDEDTLDQVVRTLTG